MRAPKERFDFVHQFLKRVFIDDLHAKRVLSLANGALGVMTGAALAVSLIGQALAQARGLFAKSAIKQVDRLLSNAGVVPWDLFASWVREVVGERREIVVAMDWTDFDADNQSTLALHLVTRHGRATPLLWLTVDKDELKNQRNDFEDLCLSRLKALLPEGVAVTILADRGFGDVKLFEFLESLGFRYVQSTVGASPGPPGSVVVNTPVVAPPFAAPPPAAPQLPDPKALRTVSQRPDETQIATATPSATDLGDAVQARDGPQPPAKPATKGASEAAGVAQPPTHKLDLPTKLSRKPSARIVVAKTETAAPGPEADKAPETPIEPQAASEVPLVPAPKPVDPLSHAFSYIVGALGVTTASAPRPAVRGVTSEESPIELGDHASLGNAPPAANLTPTSPGEVQSTVGASPGPPGSVVGQHAGRSAAVRRASACSAAIS